eukprot:1065152-Rhodomonas_salina.1
MRTSVQITKKKNTFAAPVQICAWSKEFTFSQHVAVCCRARAQMESRVPHPRRTSSNAPRPGSAGALNVSVDAISGTETA